MSKFKFITNHIPNAITCCNLLSGTMAIYTALACGDVTMASFWIILAAVFDFFDGFSARLLKAYSNIGKDLDSLADVVSFGVAPAMLMFACLDKYEIYDTIYMYPVFVLGAFAALRLAKFNNDTRQTTSFIGLPVPSNALFWIGLADILLKYSTELREYRISTIVVMYLLVALFSFLMVSELPMFSLKLSKDKTRKELTMPLIVIFLGVASFVRLGMTGFAVIILFYIFVCVASLYKNKQKK